MGFKDPKNTMEDRIFANEDQMKKFWARAMRDVNLDAFEAAPYHASMKQFLEIQTQKLETILQNIGHIEPPRRGWFAGKSAKQAHAENIEKIKAYNASVNFILRGDPNISPEDRPYSAWPIYPKAITLTEIRHYIENGQYDKALEALDYCAGVNQEHPKLKGSGLSKFRWEVEYIIKSLEEEPRFLLSFLVA